MLMGLLKDIKQRLVVKGYTQTEGIDYLLHFFSNSKDDHYKVASFSSFYI